MPERLVGERRVVRQNCCDRKSPRVHLIEQICVLGLAHSRIFIVYYFRMYLALVAAGCFYGLLVLPILLAIFGPVNPATTSSRCDEAVSPPASTKSLVDGGSGRMSSERGRGGHCQPLARETEEAPV